MTEALAKAIEQAWETRDTLTTETRGEVREAVETAIDLLDSGEARVASPNGDGSWTVHQWLKKAVLLSFRLNANGMISGVPGGGNWWDKVPSKFQGWGSSEFEAAGFRAVPPAAVRRGAFIAKNAVLMPSYVNIGAYVGARSEVVEGVVVGEGSVIAMGVFITQSTKIVNRHSGEITYGKVPPYSVVVPGTLPDKNGGPSLACAVIVKTVDAQTRSKTGVNELLRD